MRPFLLREVPTIGLRIENRQFSHEARPKHLLVAALVSSLAFQGNTQPGPCRDPQIHRATLRTQIRYSSNPFVVEEVNKILHLKQRRFKEKMSAASKTILP